MKENLELLAPADINISHEDAGALISKIDKSVKLQDIIKLGVYARQQGSLTISLGFMTLAQMRLSESLGYAHYELNRAVRLIRADRAKQRIKERASEVVSFTRMLKQVTDTVIEINRAIPAKPVENLPEEGKAHLTPSFPIGQPVPAGSTFIAGREIHVHGNGVRPPDRPPEETPTPI